MRIFAFHSQMWHRGAMSVVTVHGLTKQYGELSAVAGVDLTINQGEIFSLLGPNGAGKTTTVEILEGFRPRTSGNVSVLGVDPNHGDSAWRNRLGIVHQNSQDAGDLNVAETVHHFAKYYQNPRSADEVIAAVGLDEKRSSLIRNLSGGQRRRLDVALGIIGNPELLFLDEPTTGFDPEARRQFWDLIRSLQNSGTTILLTTHYLDEAEALADRVAVINRGKIVEVATPATLGNRQNALATIKWRDGETESDKPTEFVKELSAKYQGEVPELQVIRPSLEDIYLKMIGE
jgi:ABC-2 type transport system ATP-binding protein